MWQKETFAPDTIDQELAWAEGAGMNSIRIFLHDLLWRDDPAGLIRRIEQVLGIAQRHGIGALIVFFDSVWHPSPQAGPQQNPQPGIHNSRWVQSPGIAVLRDTEAFDRLAFYIKGVISHFASDARVHAWDLWNEPDNPNLNSYGSDDLGARKAEVATDLLPRVFGWARSANPSQPLTCGLWAGDWGSEQTLRPLEKLQLDLSDVISFHCYGPPDDLEVRIRQLQRYERPILCTEYMARGAGSTLAGALPILSKQRVGAYIWGLVAGRSQTNYPWDSWQRPYRTDPVPWFHDLFHANGMPYTKEEVDLLLSLAHKSRSG
jgi:hypothetical protein